MIYSILFWAAFVWLAHKQMFPKNFVNKKYIFIKDLGDVTLWMPTSMYFSLPEAFEQAFEQAEREFQLNKERELLPLTGDNQDDVD